MDDAKRKKSTLDIHAINQLYAPFCHGTSSYNAEDIDREGLKPRKWRRERRESMYEGELESKEDRVYLASVSKRFGACVDAMESAYSEEVMETAWLDGVFYVLEAIPAVYRDKLTIDEDCKGLGKSLDKECKTAIDSLELIGSLGVKRLIPRANLIKMTPKEFYQYARQFFKELPEWREFIIERVRNISFYYIPLRFILAKTHNC
jgi:hypothetical protein